MLSRACCLCLPCLRRSWIRRPDSLNNSVLLPDWVFPNLPTWIVNKRPSEKNPAPTDGRWDCLLTFQQLAYLSKSLCLHTVSVLLPSGRNSADKKDFSDRDGTVNSVSHRTERSTCVATVCISFSCILAIVWTVIAHGDPNHQGCQPGARTILGCVWDIARGRIHPLFYPPAWLIATGSSPASHSVRFELQTHSR